MPDREDREDEKETIYVPVVVRDEYEPFSERHPRRAWHVGLGLLLVSLGVLLFLAIGWFPWPSAILAVALVALGLLTTAEGLVSPLTRSSAILHVAAAALSVIVIGTALVSAIGLAARGAWSTAVVALVVALATAYRLFEHRKSTREAWAVARKGAPAWWRTGRRPGNGKD